jgi:hypothetical protein
MPRNFKTRETWLAEFTRRSKKIFAGAGAPLPDKIRMSVGFPSAGIRGKAIGECWTDTCSEDGTFEIFITPTIADPSRIADILTHELVHAAVGIDARHGPKFKRVAVAVGLQGKMTATVAGERWHEWANPVLAAIGPLPHAVLTSNRGTSTAPPKQVSRQIKCECDSCGFIFRASAQWIESSDLRCPDSGCEGAINVG